MEDPMAIDKKLIDQLLSDCKKPEHIIGENGLLKALEPRGEWEGSRTRGQDFKPDLGNSGVRHYRGDFENVGMVEMRSQLAIERAGMVTLHLGPARRSSFPTIDLAGPSSATAYHSRVQRRLENYTFLTFTLPQQNGNIFAAVRG